MMNSFIPDPIKTDGPDIPYFEDGTAEHGIAGQGTKKSIRELQAEIRAAMGRLNASVVDFLPGKVSGRPIRYGYRITFVFKGIAGRIDVAGLPMRKEAPARKEQVLKQALYMLREILESRYYESLLLPGSIPLMPYLIGKGDKTVTEAMIESGSLPMLSAGKPVVVVGELVD
jgi:hypothetical protein